MAADVFGYIELSNPDAVPKNALVHSFELRRRGEDLIPYMMLMGEEPSTPHIEMLKNKQEKRRAERRVLTTGKIAVEADTPVVADTPETMEIPLYHFASDIESFLENPNVVKVSDILPKESPLLRSRAVSDAGAVEFAVKSSTPGITFSRSRVGFTDFFVGPVGDRDHRVALHGFLTRPLPINIQGRGQIILQPGFEMVSILTGKIIPGIVPKGKKVEMKIPETLPSLKKFTHPEPVPGYFEPQDPESLGCGRHALNNLLGGTYFVKDDEQEITDENIQTLEIPVSLMSVCRYLVTKKQVLGDQPCSPNENYEDSAMMGALRAIGYSATPIVLDEIVESDVGFIANVGDHWVSLRRKGDEYELIDSLKKEGEPVSRTLDQIRESAKKGDYRSLIKVEFVGSYISPVPEEAPVTPVLSNIMETLIGTVSPPSPRLIPDEGLSPEENDIGQRARDESADLAHKVSMGIPGGPVPEVPEGPPEGLSDEENEIGKEAREASVAEARKAAQGFSLPIPTRSTTSSQSSVSMPKSSSQPKCLKVQGTVDEYFNENIHTAIREFIRTTKPGLLNAENEQKALQHQPLNSYLQEIQTEKSGKAYTLLLPTREGIRTQTNRNVEAYFTGWTVPSDCTMGGDIVKISVTSNTGYAIVNPTVGGGAVEWTYFKFELVYV